MLIVSGFNWHPYGTNLNCKSSRKYRNFSLQNILFYCSQNRELSVNAFHIANLQFHIWLGSFTYFSLFLLSSIPFSFISQFRPMHTITAPFLSFLIPPSFSLPPSISRSPSLVLSLSYFSSHAYLIPLSRIVSTESIFVPGTISILILIQRRTLNFGVQMLSLFIRCLLPCCRLNMK